MLRYRISSSAFVLWFVITTALGFSSASSPSRRVDSETGSLTITQVLDRVRKAVRYDKIRKLKYGFAVEEVPAVSNNPNGFIYRFGRGGKVRREGTGQNRNPFVFDGKDGWSVDPRIDLAVPNSKSGREKVLFPAWIRSGWWLDEKAPLTISLLEGETTRQAVALSMKFTDGRIEAKLFVSRETWLPERLVVEYAAGPYTVALSDYRQSLGFFYPRQIKTNYRKVDSMFQVKSVTANSSEKGDEFIGFRRPNDTTFDNSLPERLTTARGEGEGGHYFVRPLIDGKAVGPFNFDSGYFGMALDAKIADELGMPVLNTTKITGNDGKVQTVTLRRGKTFQLGRLIIKEPLYMVLDLSDRSAPPGEKRAGVCGYPIFARSVVEVARGGEQIAIYDPANYKLPHGTWQELFYASHAAGAHARLEGDRKGFFMLDTGGSGTVFIYSAYSKEQGLLNGRQTTELTGEGSGGGTLKTLVGQLQWFEFGGHRFTKPTVEFSIEGEGVEEEDIAGIIGRDFMKHFRLIVFNFPAKRIAFIK